MSWLDWAFMLLFALIVVMQWTNIVRMDRIEKRLDNLEAEKPAPEAAQKFRVRTAQADPKRQTRQKQARLRAFKTRTPEPRRGAPPR